MSPGLLRRHAGLAMFLAIVAPLAVAFCWHDVIASVGDDSVSYIAMARHLSPFSSDTLAEPWLRYYSHFPPLFPLLLALTGGAWNFFAAHMLVAACAVLAATMVYAYGVTRFGTPGAGLLLAIVFVLLPTAWISVTGILSEPLYLALSLAALAWHDKREPGGLVVLSLLFAAAYMTRVAGVALLAAYAAHLAVRAVSRRERPALRSLLPIAIPVVLQLAWMALRPPLESRGYQMDLRSILGHWIDEPARVATKSWQALSGGWISSFTGDSEEPFGLRVLFGVIAAMGLAGAIRGALANRLDSWYVLASLAMLVLWVFSEDNQRRLLYPLLPLMLVHAAEALAALVQMVRDSTRVKMGVVAGAAFVIVLSAPATFLVFQKSLDRDPFISGFGYSPAAMTDYYTTVNIKGAHALAWRHAAVLAGLESIDRATPPGSRVMWVRPEYVAILGRRESTPWYHSWDRATLAREIRRSGATHVVAARLFKSDLSGADGDAYAAFAIDTPSYLRTILVVPGPEPGVPEFVLLEVDAKELEQVLR
ncbi:MAG: hypothetical protein WA190_12430 [Usitatibacter sp.]